MMPCVANSALTFLATCGSRATTIAATSASCTSIVFQRRPIRVDEFLKIAKDKGLLDLLDCDFLKGKVPYGEYWWCEKFSERTGLPPIITIYDCIELCPNNFLSDVELKDELRIYMGPKYARVPRGVVVKLVAVVNRRMAIFEWNGERYNCPIRLLWRIREGSR